VPELTSQMILVMGIIAFAIFLFIAEWVRVDVVGIIMMVILPILGLVTGQEAFSGFASNAVISIIAVIIIGAGLDRTGIINKLVKPILKIAGNSEKRITILISVTVAFISSFMQNIGAAALFLPALQRISKKKSIPLSNLLMPIGFACILGGTITLVGCSPLILLNDLLKPFNLKPFGLFDVTPIGLTLVASGIFYFIVFGRFVLPRACEGGEEGVCVPDWRQTYQHLGDVFEMKTAQESLLNLNLRKIRDQYLVHVVAIAPNPTGVIQIAPAMDDTIPPNADVAVYGLPRNVELLAKEFSMQVKDKLETFEEKLSPSSAGTVEAVVGPRSELVGKTLRKIHLKELYQVNTLGIHRNDRHGSRLYFAGLSDIVLQAGDTVLLQGTWEHLQILHESNLLIFVTPLDVEKMQPEKAWKAVACFALAVGLVIFAHLKLSVCLMAGALGMILTNVLTVDEAYESVDWRTIFLLAGLIPLGIATEKTGTAAYIAHFVLGMIGQVSPMVLFLVIALLATVFTLVISNVGATVLLVPLVVNMAVLAKADPRMAALIVGIATSNSFMLPTHQVNALYMGPGGYSSVDFMKAGGIMSIIFIFVTVAMIGFFYG